MMKRLILLTILHSLILSFPGKNLFAQYCNYSGLCGDDYIVEFSVNGFKNKTDVCDSYSDFTSSVDMYAIPGGNLELRGTWNTYTDGAIYVFIDWDQNEAWDQVTEMYVLATGSARYANLTVPIPTDIEAGMEIYVRCMQASSYEAPDPCAGSPLGIFPVEDVEDYKIQMVESYPTLPSYCSAYGNGGNHPTQACNDTTRAFDTYVTSVEFENNFSNAANECSYTSKGYSDYSTDFLAVAAVGEEITINVDLFSESTATNKYTNCKLWIDWNGDKTFTEGTEEVVATSGVITNTSFTFTTTINETLTEGYTGETRIRIAGFWNFVDGVYRPCDAFPVGEVEDYTMYIGTLPPNCAENLSPTDATPELCQTGIDFSWEAPTDGTTPTGYKISLGTDNPPTTIYDGQDLGDTLKFTLPDSVQLTANTQYFWSITPYDDNGEALECAVLSFNTAVNGDPTVDILSNGISVYDFSACSRQDKDLTAFVNGGTGNLTYEWTGDNTNFLDVTDKDSVLFNSPDANETYKYFVLVTDDNGCTAIDSATVTTKEGADAGNISGNFNICPNEELTMTVSNTVGTIQWQVNQGSGFEDISGATQETYSTFNYAANYSYRVTATNGSCTDVSGEVDINLFALSDAPTITSNTGAFAFCAGDEITLTSSKTSDNVWSTGSNAPTITVEESTNITLLYIDENGCESDFAEVNTTAFDLPAKPEINEANENLEVSFCAGNVATLSINSTDNIAWNGDENEDQTTFEVATEGNVFVTVTNSNNCSSTSDMVSVIERVLPEQPTITTENNETAFCFGESIELSSNATGSVFWNNDPAINTATINANEAKDYTVTAVNEFGCTATSEAVTIDEKAIPTEPVIDAATSGITSFCENDSLLLTATASDPVFWNGDENINSTAIYAKSAGDYYVTAIAENGCTSESETVSITENELPETPVVTKEDGKLKSSVSDASLTYQWFHANGDAIEGATSSEYENPEEGTFYVVVTTPEGCSSTSDMYTGIAEFTNNTFSVYPNPVSVGDKITVKGNFVVEEMTLYSAMGQEVQRTQNHVINTENLAPGTYFIHLQTKSNKKIKSGMIMIK